MRTLLLLSLGLATAAPAAERKLFVSTFDRLRVDGPVRVVVTTGRSPRGTVAGDPRALDAVEVRQEGTVVQVRRPLASDATAGQPITVTLVTPSLASASLVGAGAITVAGMKGDRVDLSIAGTGTIAVTGADAGDLAATSLGSGRITVAGRARRTRLTVNGAGGIQADGLEADELAIRLDGPGEIAARARYTATVSNTGLGRVTVAGPAKCTVKAAGGGPVTCGTPR